MTITIHGLRRTFASLAEWIEMLVGIVAEIMGHKPSATAEKHYKSRPLELLGIWHAKYEAWILEQAGIEFKPQEGAQLLMVVGGTSA
jgi:integrase